MQKMSFLTGLATGVVASIVAVIAVPGLTTPKQSKQNTRARVVQLPAERARPPWRAEPEPEQAADSAAAIKKLKDAEEMMAEARALEARFLAARRRSNETVAIATLRNIVSAQAQFQSTARADENNNGVGEYGCFSELSGRSPVREGRILNPPVLSTTFRRVEHGRVERKGYRFRIVTVHGIRA